MAEQSAPTIENQKSGRGRSRTEPDRFDCDRCDGVRKRFESGTIEFVDSPAVGIRDLAQRFDERLWNAWDGSAVEDTLAEDFAFRGTLGDETVGRDGWRAYRDQVRRGSPDFTNEIVDLVVDGSKAAARMRFTGTHSGPLLGIDGSGQTFTYDGAAFFTARSGRLVRAWVLGDLDALRRQLTRAE